MCFQLVPIHLQTLPPLYHHISDLVIYKRYNRVHNACFKEPMYQLNQKLTDMFLYSGFTCADQIIVMVISRSHSKHLTTRETIEI